MDAGYAGISSEWSTWAHTRIRVCIRTFETVTVEFYAKGTIRWRGIFIRVRMMRSGVSDKSICCRRKLFSWKRKIPKFDIRCVASLSYAFQKDLYISFTGTSVVFCPSNIYAVSNSGHYLVGFCRQGNLPFSLKNYATGKKLITWNYILPESCNFWHRRSSGQSLCPFSPSFLPSTLFH